MGTGMTQVVLCFLAFDFQTRNFFLGCIHDKVQHRHCCIVFRGTSIIWFFLFVYYHPVMRLTRFQGPSPWYLVWCVVFGFRDDSFRDHSS